MDIADGRVPGCADRAAVRPMERSILVHEDTIAQRVRRLVRGEV